MTKPGRKGINYSDVVSACKALEEQKEEISIRKVIQITGGSFSTISEYIRKWNEAKANLIKSKALPDETIEALKLAYVKMFENERKTHEMAIIQERKILDEYLRKIVDLEAEEAKLDKEVNHLKQRHESTVSAYERKFAAAESKIAEAEKIILKDKVSEILDQYFITLGDQKPENVYNLVLSYQSNI